MLRSSYKTIPIMDAAPRFDARGSDFTPISSETAASYTNVHTSGRVMLWDAALSTVSKNGSDVLDANGIECYWNSPTTDMTINAGGGGQLHLDDAASTGYPAFQIVDGSIGSDGSVALINNQSGGYAAKTVFVLIRGSGLSASTNYGVWIQGRTATSEECGLGVWARDSNVRFSAWADDLGSFDFGYASTTGGGLNDAWSACGCSWDFANENMVSIGNSATSVSEVDFSANWNAHGNLPQYTGTHRPLAGHQTALVNSVGSTLTPSRWLGYIGVICQWNAYFTPTEMVEVRNSLLATVGISAPT